MLHMTRHLVCLLQLRMFEGLILLAATLRPMLLGALLLHTLWLGPLLFLGNGAPGNLLRHLKRI